MRAKRGKKLKSTAGCMWCEDDLWQIFFYGFHSQMNFVAGSRNIQTNLEPTSKKLKFCVDLISFIMNIFEFKLLIKKKAFKKAFRKAFKKYIAFFSGVNIFREFDRSFKNLKALENRLKFLKALMKFCTTKTWICNILHHISSFKLSCRQNSFTLKSLSSCNGSTPFIHFFICTAV